MLNNNLMPWSVCMLENHMTDLEARIKKLNGCRENLTAPVIAIGSVLRPSIIGSLDGTYKTAATVTVDYYEDTTVVIGLEFPGPIAEFIGRPVFGNGISGFQSVYGDEEGLDVGFERTEVIANLAGESVMVGHQLGGGPKILSGLIFEEVAGFAVGCISAVEKHRSNS